MLELFYTTWWIVFKISGLSYHYSKKNCHGTFIDLEECDVLFGKSCKKTTQSITLFYIKSSCWNRENKKLLIWLPADFFHLIPFEVVYQLVIIYMKLYLYYFFYMRRFTSTVPARGARALNRAISNSCLWY